MKTIKLTPKQLETVTNNVKSNKDIMKQINKVSYYSVEGFIENAIAYLNATNESRMFCIIDSVSSSGMSRTMKFHSFEIYTKKDNRGGRKGYYRNYYTLFCQLGYSPVKNSNSFRIHGCGMDMVFATNYNIIRDLYHLGFIDKALCEKLEQNTPSKF